MPSVYYGKLLRVYRTTKSMTQKLKELGVNPASLPLDDAKVMRAVHRGIQRFEKVCRVHDAKYGALGYRMKKLTEEEEAISAATEIRRSLGARENFQTTMTRNLPSTSHDSGRAPDGRGGKLSVRRWTSIADERIEAARAAGFLKENGLRGKPLQSETHERNS